MINPIQVIRAIFTTRNAVKEIAQEAKMDTASGKPGWKTTEFWMNVATQLGVVWGVIHGLVPAPWNAIIPIAGTAVYTICATVRKAIADIQTTKAGAAPAAN